MSGRLRRCFLLAIVGGLLAGPASALVIVKAYRANGAPARMVQFPPHGEDGHSLFTRFPDVWKPEVEAFLQEQGFEVRRKGAS